MSKLICYESKDGIPLPCLKENSGVNPINCKGCHYEQRHNEYLKEFSNDQKDD